MNTSQHSDKAMDPCKAELSKAVVWAIQKMAPEADVQQHQVVEWFDKPPQPERGDFALPCFRFAKPLRKKPQDIASFLASTLSESLSEFPWIRQVQVEGAFLNFAIDQGRLASWLLPIVQSGEFFKVSQQNSSLHAPRPKVMIEYSQPNTHKEFHVGHVRNVALGDSLYRMYTYCGYPVIPVNYIGDEGAHTAKCIWYMDKNALTAPAEGQGEWLGEVYSQATRYLADADEGAKAAAEKEISVVLAQLEAKDGPFYELWSKTRDWSLESFGKVYEWLEAHFEKDFFESEMTEEAQEIVDQYLEKEIFERSDGAVGIDLKGHKLGYLVLRKKDGATLYATKDLALARRKFEEYAIEHSIYVVASEQQHHFRQVFKTLELMGFQQASQCYHLSYGMVVLPEGKMSSRKGTAVTFRDLRQAMLQELSTVLDKYRGDWSDEEIDTTVQRLCRGAVKFGMLSSDPVKNIVFDLKEWLSFEGYTGPYLMYAYTRTQSVLRKAKEAGHELSGDADLTLLSDESERDLMRYVYDFNAVVDNACTNHKPSILANHLYNMCRSFSRYYAAVSILKAESPPLIQARLHLADAFAKSLHQGLDLLGITPPERM